jgi:hypothetical protein
MAGKKKTIGKQTVFSVRSFGRIRVAIAEMPDDTVAPLPSDGVEE